jgi:hypothetical protein
MFHLADLSYLTAVMWWKELGDGLASGRVESNVTGWMVACG